MLWFVKKLYLWTFCTAAILLWVTVMSSLAMIAYAAAVGKLH